MPISFIDAPLGRTLFHLSAPSVIALAVQTGVSVAEVWYVGQLGTSALAGLALAYPMYMLVTMISAGTAGGVVAGAVARALGAGDQGRADILAWNSLVFAVIAAVAFAVLFLGLGRQIFTLIGGTGVALEQALLYSDTLFAGGILMWLFNVLTCVLRGAGRMRASAVVMVGAACLQIPLAGVLVLGWGGVSPLGIAGAPTAALITFGLGAAVCIWLLTQRSSPIRLSQQGFKFDRVALGRFISVGTLASVGPFLTVGSVVLLGRFVGQFGEAAFAGYGIGTRLEFLIIPVVMGIGTAVITLVGSNIGAGRLDKALRAAWTGAGAAALIVGAFGCLFALFPSIWAASFTSDAATLDSAYAYLRIAGPGYVFLGLGLTLYFASQGAGRMAWPVAAGVFRVLIILIGGLLVTSLPDLQLKSLYALILIGMAIYGITIAAAIRYGAWNKGGNPV